jgi:hypothetical protein
MTGVDQLFKKVATTKKKNAVHVVQIVYKQVALLEHKWMTAEIATGRQIKYRNVTAQI